MEIINQKMKESKISSASKESKGKNKFSFEGNALYGALEEFSEFFDKSNSVSDEFSVIKVKLERATLREASTFKHYMEKSIAEDGRNLIIDLNSCEFVDSSFFGVLVAGLKRLKSMDMKFYIVFDHENRLPIFSATGLDKIFTVFNNVETAANN